MLYTANSEFCVSQGSAATLSRWGGRVFNFLMCNFLGILYTKNNWNRFSFYSYSKFKGGVFFRHIVGPFPEHDFSRGGVKINISRYMIKLDFWPWPLLQKCFPRAWWSYSIRPGLEQDTASAMLFCLLMVLSTLRMTIDKYTVSDCRRGVSLLFVSVAIDSGVLANRVRIDKLTY